MSDLGIEGALRQIILNQNIVPTTTLTVAANPGDTSITVADSSHLAVGSMVTFNDSTAEETLPVLSKSTSAPWTVTFNVAGLGYSGLQYAHTQTTQAYTNLMSEAPVEIAPMLDRGDPVIFVMALDERVHLKAMSRDGSTYTMRIQYHRKTHRPAQAQMNANVYAKRQQTAARTDLETIAKALRTNRRLLVSGQQYAVDLGEKGNISTPFLKKSWQKLIFQDGSEQFVATLDVVVQDLFQMVG